MKSETRTYPKVIYSKTAIEAAIDAYKRIASISLSENQTHFVCSFSKCVVDEQRVICEFNDYLIELLNTLGEDMGA